MYSDENMMRYSQTTYDLSKTSSIRVRDRAMRRCAARLSAFAMVAAWCLVPRAASASIGPLPDFPDHHMPVYFTNVHSGKCLDVEGGEVSADQTPVQQFTCGSQRNQTWLLIYLGGNDYQIRTGYNGAMNLDIAGASQNNGAVAQIYSTVSIAQIFQFNSFGNGTYEIVSKNSGKCLDVPSASTAEGQNLQQYTCGQGDHQRWTISPRSKSFHFMAKHSRKCIDPINGGTGNNVQMQQLDCLEQDRQRWIPQYVQTSGGTTYWQLVGQTSGKCLDVTGASLADGALLQQYACGGGDNQKFSLEATFDGYLTLKAKHSGKCVDVPGASTANNVTLQQYSCTGGDNQRFFLSRFIDRHVQVVQVADSSGNGRQTATNTAISEQVARVNDIYGHYGVKLTYDPAGDLINVNSDALFNLGVSATYTCPDGSTGSPVECAGRYAAANWPSKVVIYLRPGNNTVGYGFSGGNLGFVVLSAMFDHTHYSCSDPNVYDNHFFAHEFGHYLGLQHTHGEYQYPSQSDASAAYQSHGFDESVFDGDFLSDTPPDPWYMGNNCGPHNNQGVVTLYNFAPPTWSADFFVAADNPMSYYDNATYQITPQQAEIVRATMVSRGW